MKHIRVHPPKQESLLIRQQQYHIFLSIHPSATIFPSLHHQNNILASHSYIRLSGTTLISESLIQYINLTNSLSSFSGFKSDNLFKIYLYTQISINRPSINPSNCFIFRPSNCPFNPPVCLSREYESSVGVMDNAGITQVHKHANPSRARVSLAGNSHTSELSFPKALQPSPLCLVRVFKMPPSLPCPHTFHDYDTFGESCSC